MRGEVGFSELESNNIKETVNEWTEMPEEFDIDEVHNELAELFGGEILMDELPEEFELTMMSDDIPKEFPEEFYIMNVQESDDCNERTDTTAIDLSKQYEPNSKIELDGHVYETDDNGTIYKMDGELYPDSKYTVNGITYCTDDKSRKVELKGEAGYNLNAEKDNVVSKAVAGEGTENAKDATEQSSEESKAYSSLEEMKTETGKTYKEIKADKPMNSPNVVKWFEKGGTIEITEQDGKSVWTYVNPEGIKVSYIDGYPVFPAETKHPFIEDLSIGEFTGDRNEDKRLYLEKLEEEYGLTEIPEGYALHHDSENGTMQLVKEEYHKEFTHAGGHSKFKGEE